MGIGFSPLWGSNAFRVHCLNKMKRPNVAQRFLHRFIMIKFVTEFFSTRMHLIDRWILKITAGRQTITGLLGWTIIQLHTTEAKSGNARQTILIGMVDGDQIFVIASNFGRLHHPAWHHKLEGNPRVSGYDARKIRRLCGDDNRR